MTEPQPQGPPDLITSAKSFGECLLRLRERSDGIMFWNASKEFKMMLKDNEGETVDLMIVCDVDKEDLLGKILEMEHDGYMYDDDWFVVDSFEYPTTLDADSVAVKQARVNAVWKWRMCQCAKYFVKHPSHAECYFCAMSAPEEGDASAIECPICLKTSAALRMNRTSTCCNQFIHSLCLERWIEKNPTCPLCRKELKK